MTYIKMFNNSKNHFPRFESDKLIDIWGLTWLGGPEPDPKKKLAQSPICKLYNVHSVDTK